MPNLSVICVTYQDPEGIKFTLNSLLAIQGIAGLEVIVIDSSPDLSAGFISHFQSRLPMRHLTVPARGIYSAMNTGIAAARGEILWFLNGGDQLKSPALLHEALSVFEEHPSLTALSYDADLTRQGEFRYVHAAPVSWQHGLSGRQTFCHQAMLYRAEAFRSLFPFQETYRLAADYDLHLRAFLRGLTYQKHVGSLVAYDTSGASAQSGAVMKEIKNILAKQLESQPIEIRNELEAGWQREMRRHAILDFMRRIPGSNFLQPLWLQWNRLTKSPRKGD